MGFQLVCIWTLSRTPKMLYSPVGCHILNKTNYLVDIYNPAEVCDNGAPCLLRQTHAFSLQRVAERPSPAPAAEECTPIPCLLLPPPAQPGEPSLWEYPGITSWQEPSFLCCFWANFNDSSCIHAHLWLAFLNFFFLPMFWSAKLRVVCLTMCNAWRTDGLFSSTQWHAKMKFYSSNFSLWIFIWNGCFNSYFATQQLHCISFGTGYNLMTNSALSSQQSAFVYLTKDYLKLPSCTNTYLEKVCVLENSQCRQGKWFSKSTSSSGNGYPGSQAHCSADYTDGLPFSRTDANSLFLNLQILL